MKAILMKPTKAPDKQAYIWPQLEVRQSNEANAGYGVFASQPIRYGTMIPIILKPTSSVQSKEYIWKSHGFIYNK
jgi:hypothetical protein